MLSIFNRPYPADFSSKHLIKTSVLAGALVFSFIFLIHPWGMLNSTQFPMNIIWSLIISFFCTFWILFHFVFLQKCFPSFINESSWNIGKHLGFFISICFWIGCTVFIINGLLGDSFSLKFFLITQYYSALIALIPISGVTLINQQVQLKKFQREAFSINENYNKPTDNKSEFLLSLTGENAADYIQLAPENLICLKAADNYIEIYYVENECLNIKLLRCSLKKAETDLTKFKFFYRCHRSYIVNLSLIKEVKGNAQGLSLIFGLMNEAIPVSRSLTKELKGKLM
jgi:hypothetical protein